MIRELTTFMLEDAGYDVVRPDDGLEAIQALDADVPTLLLLDIMMPDVDGCGRDRELLRDI